MIRPIGIVLAIVAFAAALIWLATQPGTVTIVAGGYEIRTGIGIAVLVAVLLFAVLMLAIRLLAFLVRAWRRFGQLLKPRRRGARPVEAGGSPVAPNPSRTGASTSESQVL